MHRLGDENTRIVFIQLQQQRRAVGHHRDKLLIADPGRVKQNVVTKMTDFVDHLTGIVDRAVVGSQLDDCQPEGTRQLCLFCGYVADLFAQIRFIKAVFIDPTDKTKRVTGSLQIYRSRPRLNKRTVVIRFVVVAIEQHQITPRQQRIGDHFIRR